MSKQYIIVHTREGYAIDGGYGFLSFTKHIADATVFTNYEQVKTLCNRHLACAWVRDNENDHYQPCYQPLNRYGG